MGVPSSPPTLEFFITITSPEILDSPQTLDPVPEHQEIKMSTPTAEHIVFVDIPDTDNVLMAFQILRVFPDEHIAIVLSPRPVDLRVHRYGAKFDDLCKKAKIQ